MHSKGVNTQVVRGHSLSNSPQVNLSDLRDEAIAEKKQVMVAYSLSNSPQVTAAYNDKHTEWCW